MMDLHPSPPAFMGALSHSFWAGDQDRLQTRNVSVGGCYLKDLCSVSLWSGAWPVLGPKKGRGSVCCPGTCWPHPESRTQHLPELWSSWGPPAVRETRLQRAL